ncbi:MAG: hypothetical protein SFX73_00465 [Kofleriaceae bacterium]|nr:hypothetical protein [Kofleriaceae bacterium]
MSTGAPDRPLTEAELGELERDLESRRRTLAAHTPIPLELYERDVSRLLASTRAMRERLRALIIKARVTAEASLVRANAEGDAELRGRLLGQARACSHLAERVEWIVGA